MAKRSKQKVVEAGVNPSSITSGIQEAIDSLGEEGGTVQLKAGVYLLKTAVFMRNDTSLIGSPGVKPILQGEEVLIKAATRDIVEGTRELHVIDTEGLQPGMIFYVPSQRVASRAVRNTIVKIDGKCLLLADAWTFSLPKAESTLWTIRPLIEAHKVKNITIRDLSLDSRNRYYGGRFPNTGWNTVKTSWASSINVRECENVEISGCSIRNAHIAGIMVGTNTKHVVIRNCVISHIAYDAIHHGAYTEDVLIENNIMYCSQYQAGVFFCWYDRDTVVRGNEIYDCDMGIPGIDWYDTGTEIYDNIIVGTRNSMKRSSFPTINSAHIGDSPPGGGPINPGPCLVRNNLLLNNCTTNPGMLSGIHMMAVHNSRIEDNYIVSDRGTHKFAVETGEQCDSLRIVGNKSWGNAESAGYDLKGTNLTVENNDVKTLGYSYRFVGTIANASANVPFEVQVERIDSANGKRDTSFNDEAVLRIAGTQDLYRILFSQGLSKFEMAVPIGDDHLLVCTDGNAASISNPFDVVGFGDQPTWQPAIERISPVHHFAFDSVSKKRAGEPFEVTLRAMDESGEIAAYYTGWTNYAKIIDSDGLIHPIFVFFQDGIATAMVTVPEPAGNMTLHARRVDELMLKDNMGIPLVVITGESNSFEVLPQ